jgi:hypothetical protein
VKTSKEITQEIRRIRERAKSLSGFWISEFAAAIATLEWAAGKRDKTPSEDIGSSASEHGKIAERLLEAVSKEAKKLPTPKPPTPKLATPKKPSKPKNR